MTSIVVPLLNGVSLVAAFVLLVRTVGRRHAVPLHAGMLLVAPLVYVWFSTRAGDWSGLGIELIGTAIFGAAAFLGLCRSSARILGVGWLLHPLWDVALHTVTSGAAYTPEGYVVACIGFDLLLGGLLLSGAAGIPAQLRRQRRVGQRRMGFDQRTTRGEVAPAHTAEVA